MSTDAPLNQFAAEIRTAVTVRLVEQRLLRLFSEGKLFGTVHTCIGQEFVGVSVARRLTDADTIFSNHRGHGHFLAYRRNIKGLIGEIMGKSVGVCGGRGGSQHVQQDGFYSNGIQGGIVPVTTGMALAHKMQGTGGIAVVYVGDGTLGQGALYESMNIASKWDLPVLFVCENNLYAQSTSQTQTLAGDICARAAAFGIETAHSDTWDWPALFDAMERSIAKVRAASRPLFHRVDTYRLMAHSKGDDNRPESDVQPYRDRDPINILMRERENDPAWRAMLAEIEREIEDAVREADEAPWGDVESDIAAAAAAPRALRWKRAQFEREKCVASVRKGLEEALDTRDNVVLIGEDIESPYGGAFKCTQGLSARHPARVRNTPISELAIVGIGNGLALRGMIPVVEIMFGDFMTLAADQWINHAAKFRFMYNGKVRVPLVVRTPMGGKRGYAATHSQSLEKHFVGVPDTRVLCLNHRVSPALLYRALFQTIDRPTLVIENKLLYGQNVSSEPPAGWDLLHTDEPFPTAWLRAGGGAAAEVTIVALGGAAIDAEEAARRLFEEDEVAADVFMPTCLYPFDVSVLADSLSRTRRLVVVEEGQGFVSPSGEIVAQAAERFGANGLCCRRVTAAPVAIPAARPLEARCLPRPEDVVHKCLEVARELVHH
jgi:2-oxoisovalerate dehydrogenase E1 component